MISSILAGNVRWIVKVAIAMAIAAASSALLEPGVWAQQPGPVDPGEAGADPNAPDEATPGPAEPDPEPEKDPEAERRAQQARTIFEDASRFLQEGKLEEALERYRIAYDLSPRPKIQLNIATLLLELGRPVDAANAFAEYLVLDGKDPERVPRVRELLRELDAKVGRLEARIEGPGGAVRLDGRVVGNIDDSNRFVLLTRVAPGEHIIEVARPRGPGGSGRTVVVARRSVRVAAGGETAVLLRAESNTPIPELTDTESSEMPLTMAFIRVDFDPINFGVVAAPGLALRVVGSWQIYANALLGRRSGGELGIRWEPQLGFLRLRASASVPVFFADGARAGGRATLGAVWGERLRVVFETGVAYHVSVPGELAKTVLLTAVAAELGF